MASQNALTGFFLGLSFRGDPILVSFEIDNFRSADHFRRRRNIQKGIGFKPNGFCPIKRTLMGVRGFQPGRQIHNVLIADVRRRDAHKPQGGLFVYRRLVVIRT